MSESPSATAADVNELFALLIGTRSVQDFLAELSVVTSSALGVSCGITMRRGTQPLTVASSDARARALDEVQYGLGQGPCLQTLDTGKIVSVPDMYEERRWDGYPAHALANGIGSSLSLPMSTGQGTGGALNLYASDARSFEHGADVARATAFAAQGSAVLGVALRQAEQSELTAQLREALTSRSTIDQAIGIIMGQQRCDATQAFVFLRAASQGRNRKLRDIAVDIVTSVGGAPPAPTGFDDPR